jgi:transposase InsO family protein
MSWQEKDKVMLRKEFVLQGIQEGANISELYRRYNISRKTGYKWIKRYKEGRGLEDQSQKPHHIPKKTESKMVEGILGVRQDHPCWGARKIKAVLSRRGEEEVPAKSTIHKILKSHGSIHPDQAINHHYTRFEHEAPNHLWQMDFKGHFSYEKGRCHPLTVLDDHSRFSLVLKACEDEKGSTVKEALIEAFQTYGLPQRINVDNGNPWGSLFEYARYTTLSVWMIRLGIQVSYSRPYHPQTNGKDERFHRTLKEELLKNRYFKNQEEIQRALDEWRRIYNCERPHEGIGMKVPAERYQVSYRGYPKVLPEVSYSGDYKVRKGDQRGRISFEGRQIFVGMPFVGEMIGVREKGHSSFIECYYAHQKLGEIDLSLLPKKRGINLYSHKIYDN